MTSSRGIMSLHQNKFGGVGGVDVNKSMTSSSTMEASSRLATKLPQLFVNVQQHHGGNSPSPSPPSHSPSSPSGSLPSPGSVLRRRMSQSSGGSRLSPSPSTSESSPSLSAGQAGDRRRHSGRASSGSPLSAAPQPRTPSSAPWCRGAPPPPPPHRIRARSTSPWLSASHDTIGNGGTTTADTDDDDDDDAKEDEEEQKEAGPYTIYMSSIISAQLGHL